MNPVAETVIGYYNHDYNEPVLMIADLETLANIFEWYFRKTED